MPDDAITWDDLVRGETTFAPGPQDPLGFTDVRTYPDRLREAARRSGESEAVVVGTARLGGRAVVVAVMDFGFLGGSMGLEVGRRVTEAAALALAGRLPLLIVCASGGAPALSRSTRRQVVVASCVSAS